MALGELESAVMHRLWEAPEPVTVQEMVDWLRPDRPLAYTTVLTVLSNLHRKGLLMREKRGRAHAYRTLETREIYTAALMNDALGRASDRQGTLLRFVEKLDQEELGELRRTVESLTGEAHSKRDEDPSA